MKKLLILFIFIFFKINILLSSQNDNNNNNNKFIIGCCDKSGLFGNFFGVLSNLAWCDKNQKIPIIFWSNTNLYYQKGYNSSGNVWLYYFEPVSKLKYDKLENIWKNYEAPDGSSFKYSLNEIFKYREEGNKIINKYIKIKLDIKNKINNFYKKNMLGKKTIGIHLRGTDKYTEIPKTDINLIIDQANKFKGFQCFIATDEDKILNMVKKKLKSKVISYPSYKSKDGKPIHFKTLKTKAKLGEDVLIESILLSKCDILIHTFSFVSIASLFFNPKLKNIMFHDNKIYNTNLGHPEL